MTEISSEHENDNEDLVPEFTDCGLTVSQMTKLNIELYASKRVLSLFISHLLNDKIVKNHDKLEKYFEIANMAFRKIRIRGTVTELQTLKFKTKDRLLICVDDGTATLNCYLEENPRLENLKYENQSTIENLKLALRSSDKCPLLTATSMMLQNTKDAVDKLNTGFDLGDTVEFVGKLSEHKDKRTCFIWSIVKVEDPGNLIYLEQLHNFYRSFNLYKYL